MSDTELEIAWKECGSGLARQAVDRLRNLALQGDASVGAAAASRREWIMGWALFQLGETEEAFAHAQQARSLAAQLDDAAKARAEALCGWGLSILGLGDESFAAASLAASTAAQCGDPWAVVFSLHVLAVVTWLGGDVAGAIPISDRALAAARQLGDTHLESWVLLNQACMATDLGDAAKIPGDEATFVKCFQTAIEQTSKACDLAEANSDSWTQRIALANNAEFHSRLGRYEEAHRLLDAWKKIGGDIVGRRWVHYWQTEAEVLRLEGRLEEARECGEQALALANRNAIVDMVPLSVRILSEIHEASGEFEIALKLYKQYRALELKLEGEKVKRRARVAAVIYETEKHRKQAEAERERADHSEREASIDPLTGVGNRRMMERTFETILARGKNDVAIVFADLDHFKAVNDRYSHAVGDEVIKAFAGVLADCCRQGDLVARMGGEEFVLLLDQDLGAHGAESVCNRVLTKMREYPWGELAQGLSMTASLGFARLSEVQDRDALLALADARMYRAKQNGRNCAVTEGGLDSIQGEPPAAARAVGPVSPESRPT